MKEKRPVDQDPAGNKDYRILVLLVVGLLIGLNVFVKSATIKAIFSSKNQLPVSLSTIKFTSPEEIPAKMRPFFFLPVNVNNANQDLLESVPGIGPELAARIIILRNERNGFADLNELLDVEGIGPKKLAKIRRNCSL